MSKRTAKDASGLVLARPRYRPHTVRMVNRQQDFIAMTHVRHLIGFIHHLPGRQTAGDGVIRAGDLNAERLV